MSLCVCVLFNNAFWIVKHFQFGILWIWCDFSFTLCHIPYTTHTHTQLRSNHCFNIRFDHSMLCLVHKQNVHKNVVLFFPPFNPWIIYNHINLNFQFDLFHSSTENSSFDHQMVKKIGVSSFKRYIERE